MEATTTDWLLVGIGGFCFGYPFVMAWYWMVGGLLFYITRERHMAPSDRPPLIEHPPPISILVPCYNEGDNAEETSPSLTELLRRTLRRPTNFRRSNRKPFSAVWSARL